jgi:protein TonB
MAYLDTLPLKQRLASLGTAGAIELAIAAALIGALSYNFVAVPKPKPPTTFDATPTPTPVPPDPQASPEPTDSRPTAPIPPTTLDPVPDPVPTPTTFDPLPPVQTGGGTTLDPPVRPTPRLTPVAAAPSNDFSRWVTTDDYPQRDLINGNEGTTRFRVVVGNNGRVLECEVTRSSGSASLDRAACNNVKRRARFEAATDETGAKVVGTYTSSVVWRIPTR